MSTDQRRFEDIESKLSHQEYTVQQLDDIVAGQQQKISQLELMVFELNKRVKEMSQGESAIESGHEQPPHY